MPIRDGVGIDRDSERAREGVKFDFEVVPPQTEFKFTLMLENPCDRDLGLIALGLQEFIHGMIPLGGIRSRGLGRCHLEEVKVQKVDLRNIEALKAYFLKNQWTEELGLWTKSRIFRWIMAQTRVTSAFARLADRGWEKDSARFPKFVQSPKELADEFIRTHLGSLLQQEG